jgi:hypothetical protein
MKTLQEKVQSMLDGETKRRETALQFITEVTEILLPVAKDIWGKGNSELSPNVVWINREEKGNLLIIILDMLKIRMKMKDSFLIQMIAEHGEH